MRLRTVFDSNFYIAAALRPGGHADLWLDIAAVPRSGLQLFVSEPILDEVGEKLLGLEVPQAVVTRFLERMRRVAKVVEPTERVRAVKDDPDDDVILECAIAAKAHLIASADHHLLKLNPYRGIGITHPRELRHILASDFEEAS